MRKALIIAAAAVAGVVAVPGSASAGPIYCDAYDAVQERLGHPFGAYCIDDPNPTEEKIRELLELEG